jgi:hypothetical protein
MTIFVVEMLRNGDREGHSYVIGVYNDELLALKEAWEHMKFRACKYDAEITGYKVNGGDRVYWRKMDGWDTFAESCKDTAEKVRAMMEEDEKKQEANETKSE